MKTNYQPPISTLAEVRELWRYLGAASQCNLLREFRQTPAGTDEQRLSQLCQVWRMAHNQRRAWICEFVEEVADTVRGQA